MKHFTEFISWLTVAVGWIAGVVVSSGFWSTTAAICVPPYAWYLLVERAMRLKGWA